MAGCFAVKTWLLFPKTVVFQSQSYLPGKFLVEAGGFLTDVVFEVFPGGVGFRKIAGKQDASGLVNYLDHGLMGRNWDGADMLKAIRLVPGLDQFSNNFWHFRIKLRYYFFFRNTCV